MTTCQRCGGKTDQFLCRSCTTILKGWLAELPWWLSRLTEAAVGQTRLTDNGGRKSARRPDLDGEKTLAECIQPLPAGDDLDKARRARQQSALARALAMGGCNHRASELLAQIADSLSYWVKVLCEARGLPAPTLPAGNTYGTPLVVWLHAHLDAIALSEDGGDIMGDIETHRQEIERVINRPIRWLPLGECPGVDEPCGAELRTTEHSEEVRCRRCGAVHNVHRLLLSRKVEAEGKLMTRKELTRYNRDLPAEYQVSPRSLRHWLTSGRLCPVELADDPLYSWMDVRLLASRKPQKTATGAAAHV